MARNLWMLIFSALCLSGCGPYDVHGHVDPVQVQVGGTVNVSLPSVAYLPYFEKICQSGGAGMICYNADPTACATCLMSGLSNSLGLAPIPITQ